MKTMVIPKDMLPFKVTINGVTYVYEAGTEQEVPDEVAEIIMNRKNDYPPKDREQEAPYKMPVATDTEPGAVMAGEGLVNNDGVLSVVSSEETYPVTFSPEGSSVVCDRTYDEVAEAITSGKYVYGVWVPSAYAPKMFMPGLQYIASANSMYFWQVSDASQVQTKILYHKEQGVIVETLTTDRYYPTAPTEDGTYVLKCVKSGTRVTRSWVKEE